VSYVKDDGTLLHGFLEPEYALGAGSATRTFTTTHVREGTGPKLTLAPTAANSVQEVRNTYDVPWDLSDESVITLRVYIEGLTSNGFLRLAVGPGTGGVAGNNMESTWLTAELNEGWNNLLVHKTDSADWADNGGDLDQLVKSTRITMGNSVGTTFYFDGVYIGKRSRTQVIIGHDAWSADQFDIIKAMYIAAGIKPYEAINTDGRDLESANTLAMYDAYALGWDIVNHSTDHTNLTTLSTVEEVLEKVIPTSEWLKARGFTRSSNWFIYPNNAANEITKAAMQLARMEYARVQSPMLTVTDNFGLYLPLEQGSMTWEGDTLAAAKATVDEAIKYCSHLHMYGHSMVATAGDPAVPEAGSWAIDGDPGANFWWYEDMSDLIDYLVDLRAKGHIDIVTLAEFSNQL